MIPEVNPYNNYRGDGVATLFDYDFFIQNGSQLIVEHIDENDVVTRLEENIDYEIVVIEEEFAGYIKFPIEDSKFGILQENETLSLQLTLPFEQISEYGQSSLLDLNSIEFSYDYLTRLCQILKRQMERSVKVNEGSEATPEQLLETINNNAIVSTNAATLASQKADEAMESANVAINISEEIDNKINGFNESYENIKEEIIEEGEKQLQNIESTGFYMRDDKLYFINSKGEEEEFKSGGGSGFNLFDTKISDHILVGEEAKGWALQGTYVTKAFYPDFYNKCLEEYQNESNIPFSISWIQPTLSANGTMGGNSFAVEASSQYDATVPAWKAFDGTGTSNWVATTGVIPSWITFYNPVALNVTKLTILNRTSDNDGVITAGEIQVSNNNSDWVTIKTFSNSVIGNTTAWEIDLSNNTEFYKYYRINGTSFARNYISIGEVKIQATYNLGVKHSNGHIFYDIAQKDQIDEVFASTGTADFYGIDEKNERIFLPRNKYFQQLTLDVSDVNKMMEAGLPNIEGEIGSIQLYGYRTTTGAFDFKSSGTNNAASGGNGNVNFILNASLSNPIYGNSDTVQPPSSLKLLYYCVGNTEVISSITNVTEITESENDSNPLGSSFYFNNIQPNAGWLKSEGQWNDGNIYKTFYNWLVEEKTTNTSRTDIKDVSEVYTDFDYVLNQDDMTFRLPLLNGDESIMSKKYDDIDFPNITTFTAPANGWYYIHHLAESASNFVTISRTDEAFADMVSTRILTVANNWAMFVSMQAYKGEEIKITSTSTKPVQYARFYYAKGNGDLYFKVANAVQNIELLDVGEVLEAVSDIVPKNSALITSYCCPDYQNGIVGASALGVEQTFVAPANGIISYSISAYNNGSASYIKINDVQILWSVGYTNPDFNSLTGTAIVAKGDVIKYFSSYNATYYNTQNIVFFPMKGAS